MKLRHIIFITAGACLASASYAQNINFRVEQDYVKVNGVTQGLGDLFVLSGTADPADLDALSFTTDDPNTFISELQGLATDPIFTDDWQAVPEALGPVAGANDWNSQRLNLTVGNAPVMLFSTSELDSLTSSDHVGFVSSSSIVEALSSKTVTFTGTDSWDNIILGSSGSFELTAVPEPAHYAAALGLLGLGLVIWRRRRQ